MGIQTHYHKSTLPSSKQAHGEVSSNCKESAHQSKARYLGLLEYRNTPIDDVASPAQLLMSRQVRSIVPTTEAQLQPNVLDPHKIREKLKLKQQKEKYYFDQHTRHLPAFMKRDQVKVRMVNQWEPI